MVACHSIRRPGIYRIYVFLSRLESQGRLFGKFAFQTNVKTCF